MRTTRSVASNPVVRFIADALRFYMEFHATYDGFYGAFIHDPLAAAAALDETLVRDRRRSRSTSRPSGELAAGQTIADFRGLWHRDAERRRGGPGRCRGVPAPLRRAGRGAGRAGRGLAA